MSTITASPDALSKCFDQARSNLISSSTRRFIFFEYFHLDQIYIDRILRNFSKLRDFHNDPPYLGPLVQLVQFVASAINATILSSRSVKKGCNPEVIWHIPKFYSAFGSQLIDAFVGLNKPLLIQVDSNFFNFNFCQRQGKDASNNISPLEIFRSTAESKVWLCLGASLILTTYLVRLQVGKNNSSVLLATLSALLSVGVTGDSRLLRRSWLITLWAGVSLIFVTFYSGSLTSVVMSPTKENRMSKLIHLVQNNYSLLMFNPTTTSILKGLTRQNTFQENAKIVKNLLPSTRMERNEEDFFKAFVSKRSRFAFLGFWQDSILIVHRAEEYMTKNKIFRRRCYIGEELVLPQTRFIVITPSVSKRLSRILTVLLEAGYFFLWMDELSGIAVSTRVQGRSKMISPTKLFEEKEQPNALELTEGKVRNIFFLWLFCSFFSIIIFITEVGLQIV